MIEVQMLTFGDENTEWLEECRRGLDDRVVRVHEGMAIEGNVNAARIAIWDRCGGDLLSFVDPDDVPVLGIWKKLEDTLSLHPEALGVYSLECRIDSLGAFMGEQPNTKGKDPSSTPLIAHHVLVVRRSVYEFVRPFALMYKTGIEWLMAVAAYHHGQLICLEEVGYKWRRHIKQRGIKLHHVSTLADDFLNWSSGQAGIIKPSYIDS